MSFVVYEGPVISDPLEIARTAISSGLRDEFVQFGEECVSDELLSRGGAGVTLLKEGKLRGGMATFWGVQRNRASEIAWLSTQAAFNDRRFPALRASEARGLDIWVDIFDRPAKTDISSVGDDSAVFLIRIGTEHVILEPLEELVVDSLNFGHRDIEIRRSGVLSGDQAQKGEHEPVAADEVVSHLVWQVQNYFVGRKWDLLKQVLGHAERLLGSRFEVWRAELRRYRGPFVTEVSPLDLASGR
jgi:hypothetical protein